MKNGEVYETTGCSVYTVVFLGGRDPKGRAWGLLTTESRALADARRTAPMFRHDLEGRYAWTAAEIREFLRGAKLLPMKLDVLARDPA